MSYDDAPPGLITAADGVTEYVPTADGGVVDAT
jgi:hypothetical protein